MKTDKLKNRLLYMAAATLFLILIISGIYFSRIQKDDAVRINLAGRQRMLSQKIVKEILLIRSGDIIPGSINNSLDIYIKTQNALIAGGSAPVDLKSENFRYLPEMKNKTTLTMMSEIKKEWDPIEINIIKSIKLKDETALNYVISHNEILLTKINSLVFELQLISERHNMMNRVIIISSFLMISGLLIYNLARRIKELNYATEKIKELEKLLPICSNCKRIRIDSNKPLEMKSWTKIEEYLHNKNDMVFTHSICPECAEKLYPGILEEMKK